MNRIRLVLGFMGLVCAWGEVEASGPKKWIYFEEPCNSAVAVKEFLRRRSDLEERSIRVFDFKRRTLGQRSQKCRRAQSFIACYQVNEADADRGWGMGFQETKDLCSDEASGRAH